MNIPLPELIEVSQSYPASPRLDFHGLLAEQFEEGERGNRSRPECGLPWALAAAVSQIKEIEAASGC
jgi:hypothetical protein